MAPTGSSPVDRADRLARSACAVPELPMRVAYVRSELEAMDGAFLADVLTVITARTEARDTMHGPLLLALSLALEDPNVASLRNAAAASASARGLREVMRLLDRRGERDDSTQWPVPDFGKGRPLTLGERKSLARTSDRRLLARVIRDPHPDVIRILLGNPSLTEDDVIRLCAQRPIPREVLRAVFRSPRWIVRPRVRLVLVRNPHCPYDVAMQLVPHLTAAEARDVAQSTELSPELRDACERSAAGSPVH